MLRPYLDVSRETSKKPTDISGLRCVAAIRIALRVDTTPLGIRSCAMGSIAVRRR